MKNQKVLLTWNTNWDDEMDISGFIIITQEDWEKYKNEVERQAAGGITMYIGSNQWIDYSYGSELLEEITVDFLTDIEVSTIISKIGVSFGFTQFYDMFQIKGI